MARPKKEEIENPIGMDAENTVKVILETNGILPAKMTPGSAGYDLYNPEHFVLKPGRNLIPLNIRMAFDNSTLAIIKPRSGFEAFGFEAYGFAQGPNGELYLDNSPTRIDADVLDGSIDSDYRNIINVIVKSHEDRKYLVKAGTRIAQVMFVNISNPKFNIVEELDETDRKGGFSSTGTC